MYLTIIPKISAWGGGNRQTVTRCISGSHHFTARAAVRTRSQSPCDWSDISSCCCWWQKSCCPVLLMTLPLNARREAWEKIMGWVSLASFLLSVLILKLLSLECTSYIFTVLCSVRMVSHILHPGHFPRALAHSPFSRLQSVSRLFL